MSLLINALKKYRQDSGLSQTQSVSDASLSAVPKKYKRVLLMGLGITILMFLIMTISFIVFKHLFVKNISASIATKTQNMQEKVTEKMAEKKQTLAEKGGAGGTGSVREQLEQKIQQKQASQKTGAMENTAAATTESTTSTATDTNTSNNESVSTSKLDASSTSAVAASTANSATSLQTRLADHQQKGGGRLHAQNNDDSSSTSTNTGTSTDATTSTTADTTNTSSGENNSDNASSETEQPVKIKTVTNDMGENNPTYQKALGFMQNQQYNKALALLVENDALLFKTQGLSALLMTHIYLTTGEYALAEEAIEHALLLHPGSELALLELKAQTCFMQQRYSEALTILSANSPSLVENPEYYALLANVYIQLEQPANAISVFEQIVAQFPSSAEYWLGLAVAYQKAGEVDSALVAYRRASQLSQDDPQVSLFINQQLERLQVL